ncbi:MAG: hypothetical protein WC437_00215 [Patescibacteria group bacterium]|jgi:hypothetical protein|nr:hypothetical protein [Patescibacteria group bacterium]
MARCKGSIETLRLVEVMQQYLEEIAKAWLKEGKISKAYIPTIVCEASRLLHVRFDESDLETEITAVFFLKDGARCNAQDKQFRKSVGLKGRITPEKIKKALVEIIKLPQFYEYHQDMIRYAGRNQEAFE